MESRKAFFKVITSLRCHFSEANMFCFIGFCSKCASPGTQCGHLKMALGRIISYSRCLTLYHLDEGSDWISMEFKSKAQKIAESNGF